MPKNESSKPWWMLPAGRVSPWWWAAAVVLMVGLDYAFALDARMPSLHVLPVLAAAWYTGAWCAAVVAVVLVAVQAAFVLVRTTPVSLTSALLALTAARGLVIVLLGLWFARLADHERALEGRVRTLEGLLPICSYCKNIRNDAGEWERLESYISKRSDTTFSHGLCPACQKLHFSEYSEPQS